jgi:hypothetical protein
LFAKVGRPVQGGDLDGLHGSEPGFNEQLDLKFLNVEIPRILGAGIESLWREKVCCLSATFSAWRLFNVCSFI